MTLPVSVIVLTKNEGENLPKMVKSISWCDDIHVVDSLSSDNTVAVAKALGVQTWSNAFRGFGDQRNWALANCSIKHPWILFLDADEQSTPAFAAALEAAINSAPENVAGFYCCWKMIVEEVWLKRCDHFPKWQFRLLRKGRANFSDFGHGQKENEIQGELHYLKEPYDHRPISKGWSDWLERHNRYSTQEAHERIDLPFEFGEIFSKDGPVRNRALKGFVSRVPGWPLLRFAIPYFLKLGFLEGIVGFNYCVNLAYYEFLIQIKMREIKLRRAESQASSDGNKT
jgi:glycosyltransferase involved in cell wall biosynthesis